jgi:ABC-type multidrug transport system ATPase subunit
MSTQHIEEADELADRVCIMSHGKVIALGTPMSIKRRFGVGYNIYVEARSSQNMSNQQVTASLQAAEAIFMQRQNYDGITKSKDSNDKKTTFLVPMTLVDRVSNLIAEVERDLPELQVDIELNSLEDAFIKIAEKDIEKEMERNQALAKAMLVMSPEEEDAAF